MAWPESVTRPSKWLELLMTGKIQWDEAPEPIQSWSMRFVFDAAKTIRDKGKTKEQRQAMLGRVPENMRPIVEKELLRIWKDRC